MNQLLGPQHSGGCFLFFNGTINNRGMEQLVMLATQAVANQFRSLTICMSSTGGDPESALYGYNALSSLPIALSSHNLGVVHSAAITVFLAGRERFANPGASMLFHQTASTYDGNRITEAYLLSKLAGVRREDQRTAQIIAEKTGQPITRVNEWQRKERLMDNASAVAEGLITAERTLVIPQNGWPVHAVTS
jgi:ATP-dependent Clp protease protease subunit